MFRPIVLSAALIAFSLLSNNSFSQVVFFEDFEQGMPGNFTLNNVDGQPLAPQVAYFTNAWITRTNFDDASDTVAASTSWHDSTASTIPADDWMITDTITLGSSSLLSWDAKSQDADFLENYQVRISTAGTDPADFLANFALFTINTEQAVWTSRSVSLSAYANQTVRIAFRNISLDKFVLMVDDILIRNPYPADVMAGSITLPISSCTLGSSEQISMSVENFGLNPISNFTVSYIIDDGVNKDTVTETVTATVAPGTTYDYTFSQGADLSSGGTAYTVTGYATLAGDGDNSNNSFEEATVINVAPAVPSTSPYVSSFETIGEILGWSAEDVNNDGFSWGLVNLPDYSFNGDLSFLYSWNSDGTTAANDWLFSTCLDLTAGTVYELSFYYRVGVAGSTVYPEKLKLMTGNNPAAGSMTTLIADMGALSNDFFEQTKRTFTVSSSGTYYIGFHCYSDADDYRLAIDDVTIGELQPPSASYTTGKNGLQVTFASTSTGADSLYWDFGDSENATTTPVLHTYDASGTYYVCLTAFNAAGSDTHCDSVSVTATGITALNNAAIKIYPNPTNGVVVLESSQKLDNAVAIVNDIVGKEILRQQISSAKIVFNLSEQPEGIYFVTITSGNSSIREKLLLNE